MDSPAFARRRDATIARLEVLVRDDPRLLALWLQGSLADGTADDWSDIDAYLAVRDADFEVVYAERHAVVERVGTVLIASEIPALRAVNALLDGPVKLDLIFEPESHIGEVARPAVRVLVDKAAVAARLRTGWTPPRDGAVRTLEGVFRGAFQGAAWPVRLLQRGQWTTFAATELQLVNDFLVVMMAAHLDLRLLFRNRISVPRHLPPAQRELIEQLGRRVAEVAAARDYRRALEVHLAIVDLLFREGRLAYAALDLPYPLSDSAEQAIREFYVREWPHRAPA